MSVPDDPAATVAAFNACINARDAAGIATLMAPEYTFIDSAGNTEAGWSDGVAAWAGFFAQFPDYRNVVDTVQVRDDIVIVTGRSECSVAALDGPAIWTARIHGGMVAEWRVYDDTSEVREHLGLA